VTIFKGPGGAKKALGIDRHQGIKRSPEGYCSHTSLSVRCQFFDVGSDAVLRIGEPVLDAALRGPDFSLL
jgi:hypothetical protein